MNRLLLDQGLSPITAALLREFGWDTVHVREVGLDRAEDIDILRFAMKESRTYVTLDHDFHAHLALAQMDGPSVVLIRLEGLNSADQAALIVRVWKSCSDEIAQGAAISIDGETIRVRRLPLR